MRGGAQSGWNVYPSVHSGRKGEEMKQGFVSAILADHTLEEVLDFASENGFECIEAACWPKGKAQRRYAGVTHIDVDTLDAEGASHIRECCRKRKVQISALSYYPNMMDPDPEKREFYICHLKKVIEASAMLGIYLVATFIGRMPAKGVEENIIEYERVLKPIVQFSQERKVRIAIENCPMLFTADEWPGGHNLASTPPVWRRLFSIIDSEYLGLNYDPSHFVWQGINYIRPIYEFRDKIFHVHYKDIKLHREKLEEVGILAEPLTFMTPRIPGHGDVNWGEYIAALKEIGYGGPACIEIEDKSFEGSGESIKDSLRISKRYLSQFV